jgi:hypothetical protein
MQLPTFIDKEFNYFKKQVDALNIVSLSAILDQNKNSFTHDLLIFGDAENLNPAIKTSLAKYNCTYNADIDSIIKSKAWLSHKVIIVNQELLTNVDLKSIVDKFIFAFYITEPTNIASIVSINQLPLDQDQNYYSERLEQVLDEFYGDPKRYKVAIERYFEDKFSSLDINLKQLVTEYKLKVKIDNAKRNSDQNDGYNNGIQSIKGKYTDYLTQFEKLYNEAFHERYHNTMGTKIAELEQMIENSIDLAEEKQTKKSKITITDENIKKYNLDLENDITYFFDKLTQSRNSYFKSVNEDIQLKLKDLGINYQPSSLIYNDHSIKAKVREYILLSKNDFETYIPKKRLMEYFSGSRQYVMIVIMMMSLFGLRSVISNNSEIYFPAIIVLLGLGTYGIINQSKIEDKEARRKALETAKSHVISELRNKISTIDSVMQKHFLKDLKDQINDIFAKTDIEISSIQKSSQSYSSSYSYSNSPEKIADKLQDLITKVGETRDKLKVMIAEIK